MQIKALEQELGTRLLARTQCTVELTAAGAVFLEKARGMLQRLERAATAARGEVGELAVGFITIADYNVLPAALSAFRARSPGIVLTLREATSAFHCATWQASGWTSASSCRRSATRA